MTAGQVAILLQRCVPALDYARQHCKPGEYQEHLDLYVDVQLAINRLAAKSPELKDEVTA